MTLAFSAGTLDGLLSPDTTNSEPDYATPAIFAVLGALWGGALGSVGRRYGA